MSVSAALFGVRLATGAVAGANLGGALLGLGLASAVGLASRWAGSSGESAGRRVAPDAPETRAPSPRGRAPARAASRVDAILGEPARRSTGISDAELDRRMRLLAAARVREAKELARQAADAVSREAPAPRRRAQPATTPSSQARSEEVLARQTATAETDADARPVETDVPAGNVTALGRIAVIDGNNCRPDGHEKPSLYAVRQVIREVEAQGYRPQVFFDASIHWVVRRLPLGARKAAIARELGVTESAVTIAPGDSEADPWMIDYARRMEGLIVTNDRLRKWEEARGLDVMRVRFIQGHCIVRKV